MLKDRILLSVKGVDGPGVGQRGDGGDRDPPLNVAAVYDRRTYGLPYGIRATVIHRRYMV